MLDLQRFQACLEPFCIIVWSRKEEKWYREEMQENRTRRGCAWFRRTWEASAEEGQGAGCWAGCPDLGALHRGGGCKVYKEAEKGGERRRKRME